MHYYFDEDTDRMVARLPAVEDEPPGVVDDLSAGGEPSQSRGISVDEDGDGEAPPDLASSDEKDERPAVAGSPLAPAVLDYGGDEPEPLHRRSCTHRASKKTRIRRIKIMKRSK
jgi:hypothetical protein